MRKRLVLSALLVAVVFMGATGQGTLARLTDQDTSTVSFSTDTLAPPTNLSATPVGLTASLTWTPSVDAYTAGYEIWRSTTSGSGYALVGTCDAGDCLERD